MTAAVPTATTTRQSAAASVSVAAVAAAEPQAGLHNTGSGWTVREPIQCPSFSLGEKVWRGAGLWDAEEVQETLWCYMQLSMLYMTLQNSDTEKLFFEKGFFFDGCATVMVLQMA